MANAECINANVVFENRQIQVYSQGTFNQGADVNIPLIIKNKTKKPMYVWLSNLNPILAVDSQNNSCTYFNVDPLFQPTVPNLLSKSEALIMLQMKCHEYVSGIGFVNALSGSIDLQFTLQIKKKTQKDFKPQSINLIDIPLPQ